MDKSDFTVQMDRIIQTWGPKSYPEQRIQMIWEFCKGLQRWEFKAVVDKLIGSEKYAPMPQDIEKACARARMKNERERVDRFMAERFKEDCVWCRKTGVVHAKHREKKTGFAFRCVCDFAHFFNFKYEPWSIDLETEYEPDYLVFREKEIELKPEDYEQQELI